MTWLEIIMIGIVPAALGTGIATGFVLSRNEIRPSDKTDKK